MAGGSKGRKGGKGGGGGGGGGSGDGDGKDKPTLPEGVKMQESSEGDREYRVEVGGKELKFRSDTEDAQRYDADGDISFSIAKSLDKGGLQGSDAARAGVKVLKIMRYDASTRPNGYVYSTSAYGLDGNGKDRQRIYEKVGFSKPKKAGGVQYSIVRNGKMEPYYPK